MSLPLLSTLRLLEELHRGSIYLASQASRKQCATSVVFEIQHPLHLWQSDQPLDGDCWLKYNDE